MKIRSLSLPLSRKTVKNGFFELMNALQSIQSHSDKEKNAFSAVLQIIECFLMNSKTSCRKTEYILVRSINYNEKKYLLARSVRKHKFFLIILRIENYHHIFF
jgi:hypothetical protein